MVIRMTAITRLPQVSDYAPGASANHISEVTVAAVDKIGNATSDQIRHTADAIEADAKAIGDKLRALADAFDEQTRIASEKVSEFCLKMTSARNMVRSLESDLARKIKPIPGENDDNEPSPAFLHEPAAS
jgi:uncharacterized membrane protein YqiK